jgi:hypothetical protein
MRRMLAITATAALALGIIVTPGAGAYATTDDPVPIPGGIETGLPPPNGPVIHVFAPGPTESGFMGLDIEPTSITNFDGFTAMAYLNGTAMDAEGNTSAIGLSDMRVFQGTYRTADGSLAHGTFAFI